MKTAIAILVLTLSAITNVQAQQYVISTFAGGAPPPSPIAGAQASIGFPSAVAVDSSGNAYFTALNSVFKLDSNGMMTRVAGNARAGYSGDGGAAASAQLNSPYGVAVDGGGNIYIADTKNNRIRKVSAAGVITTVAGTGVAGFSGDSGAAAGAQLAAPYGVAVDSAGNLYIADASNNRIRKVSASGTITTVAGNGTVGYSGDNGPAAGAQLNSPDGVAVDANGNIYIADYYNQVIRKVSSSGNIATVAGTGLLGYSGDGGAATGATLDLPAGVAVDSSGNLYIADSANNRVRKVSSAGTITTLAGNGAEGYSGDGGAAASAQLWDPYGVAADSAGNVYVADYLNSRIRKVSTSGTITSVVGNGSVNYSGDGGPATSAQIDSSIAVALDGAGNLYIADYYNNRIRKVAAGGTITTVAGNGLPGYSGDGAAATSAQLNSPSGVAVDAAGNIYIADTGNQRIRKVSGGTITTIAGTGVAGYSGDGIPAISARLGFPYAVAVDGNGNVYIAEYDNHRVREITTAGMIITIAGNGSPGYSGDGGPASAAQLAYPTGVAVDAVGDVYIADNDNNRVRKVSPAGIITTIAGTGATGHSGDGGPAMNAQLSSPYGVALDAAGNLYIADLDNRGVRKISGGIITTIAGNGSAGYSGDGGPATTAQLASPYGVAIDASGNVYVADTDNDAIRLLTPSGSACGYSVSPMSVQAPVAGQGATVNITAGGGCAWTVSSLPDWITMSGSATGSGSAPVNLMIAANSGAPRSAQIFVAGIAVTVSQASSVLSVSAGGVVSAADYTATVAPGSIAAMFGNFLLPNAMPVTAFPLPGTLGGLSFQFNGASYVPFFYANGGQANVQIPWELSNQTHATITATMNGQTSAAQTVNLAPYAPGIFAMNGAGFGQGAILDGNYKLVDSSNPATAGSTTIQIYCTGLGPVSNQPATGAPAPGPPNLAQTLANPVVVIGGVQATVQFSGMTPGLVGLYQVNALVPANSQKGSSVPLMISIGGVASNTVTIAVQ